MNEWRPSAGKEQLLARARLLAQIREFFAARDVMEVETPLLTQGTVTDPHLKPFTLADRYLQTSPEYAMKRLLAAGSGPIYQVCKAFRQEEAGGRHNPEFSMLEWYRPDFTLGDLMDEVEELLQAVLGPFESASFSYRQLFLEHAGIDPFAAGDEELQHFIDQHFELDFDPADRDVRLNLILSHHIEPLLASEAIVFVYDYPESQAALAQVRTERTSRHAERFEVYGYGFELANGYREITDAEEMQRRFECENQSAVAAGGAPRPLDERLLEALSGGFPECSGVALGLDRLLMLSSGREDIRQVLSFDWSRA